METNTVYMIAKLVIAIILIIVMFLYYKYRSNSKNSQKAEEFIDGLYDVLKEEMLSIINDTNPDDFSSFDQFRDMLISITQNKLKEYILNTVNKEKGSLISIAVAEIIKNDTFIIEAIDKIINKYNLDDRLNSIWIKKIEKDALHIMDEDEKLQKEFSDESKYYEVVNNDELPVAIITTPTQEELDKLIPQADISESDIGYDNNDSSIEFLSDTDYSDEEV